jgi:hypothetical protein
VQFTARVRRFATGLVLAVSASLALSTASPAWADGETEAPVAVDDAYTGYAGGVQSLKVLANDYDPQGAELSVCKVKAPEPADEDFAAVPGGDRIEFFDLRGEARTVTFTYYVCNDEFLTPATVTVTLVSAKPLRVTKLDRPGRLRFTNPNDFRVLVMYGDIRTPAPTGQFRLPAHGSEVVRVHTRRVGYLAMGIRNAVMVGSGVVRGVELPQRSAARQATDKPLVLPRRVARLWDQVG